MNPFCIPPNVVFESQHTVSVIWNEFSNTNTAWAITSFSRSSLSAQLGARAIKATVIIDNGCDWVDFIQQTVDGPCAFCRDSSGVYCWNEKNRLVSNYFRSLHDKQKDASATATAAAVGSGVETCGKTMAPSVYVVGSATSISSGCASY